MSKKAGVQKEKSSQSTESVQEVKVSKKTRSRENDESSRENKRKVYQPKKETKTTEVDDVTTSDDAVVSTTTEKKERKKRSRTSEQTTTGEETKRVPPSKESVLAEYDTLLEIINAEVARLKENKDAKLKGVKFLKSVRKRVDVLKTHTTKLFKKIKAKKPHTNAKSGLMKEVPISSELAKFFGWKPDEKKSRVNVTQTICAYIKDHGLKNKDKGTIIDVTKDTKLNKLIKYDPKKDDKPLTYARLQKYLAPHFAKAQPLESVREEEGDE